MFLGKLYRTGQAARLLCPPAPCLRCPGSSHLVCALLVSNLLPQDKPPLALMALLPYLVPSAQPHH